MILTLATCQVRSWKSADVASIVIHGNSRNIWINLRDRFPYPYTANAARRFIRSARDMQPETSFALEADGAAIGAIGYMLQTDVERVSAEIGYWVGEAYWGRGIATEALIALTSHAMAQHKLTRIFALPFAHNAASCRVLEKAGYVLEGRLRRSAIKDGVIVDQLQYAFIAPTA